MSEAEFQRRAASGSVVTETLVFGPPRNTNGSPRLVKTPIRPEPTFQWQQNPLLEVLAGNSYIAEFPVVRYFSDNEGTRNSLSMELTTLQFQHARPQTPSRVPFPGTDAVKERLDTGGCNAYIASLIAKANELDEGKGNVAVAKDGLDLLSKISGQGGFVTQDFLKINGWSVGGTVSGSIASGTATVVLSTRFMYGNSASTIAMWQTDYVSIAIHEIVHLAAKYSGYDDTKLATAASKLPGAAAGLPAPPKDDKDMNGILANSAYYDRELMRHCGPPK